MKNKTKQKTKIRVLMEDQKFQKIQMMVIIVMLYILLVSKMINH